MIEYTARIYTREEDFLEEHLGTVDAVLALLHGEWQPDYCCNDKRREARRIALATGKQHALAFDDAVISHGAIGEGRTGVVAIDVHLTSSTRFVAVRVRWEGGQAVAEKLADSRRSIAV